MWKREFILRDGESLEDLQREFASLWARFPQSPHVELILSVLKGDRDDNIGRAYQAAEEWPRLPSVMMMRDDFRRNGGSAPDEALPTKEQLAREVIAAARAANDPDDKTKLYKLYADIQGHISKEGGVNVNVGIVNRVMKVKDHGSKDQWAEKLAAQQADLISAASVH